MIIFNISNVLPKLRVKILGQLPDETKGPMMKLHNCLIGKVRLFLLIYVINCLGMNKLNTQKICIEKP